jgi:hypothetical protein
MEEKSGDFGWRPAIGKPSLEEIGFERLRDAKRRIERLQEKIYCKVEEYIEQQVKPHEDITSEEMEELKQRLFQTYKDQRVKPLEEEAKVCEEYLETAIDKDRRVTRKLEEAEREFKDVSEFELKRSSERTLRDIRREKEEKA